MIAHDDGARPTRRRHPGGVPPEPASFVAVRRLVAVVVAVHVVIGALSAWRALVQVRGLDLRLATPVVGDGSAIDVAVVSSGRVPVSVRLEMLQGAHAETLGVRRVPASAWSFYDPRPRRAAMSVVPSSAVLARFAPGPGRVRAVARGTRQFLREPPPAVREVAVRIVRR